MYAVIIGPHWRQPARLIKHRCELQQETVQQGLVGRRCDRPCGRLPDVVAGGADALPQDAAGSLGEGHAQIFKVLEDGTQRT